MVARSFWFNADEIEKETKSPDYGSYVDIEMFKILLPENVLDKSRVRKYPETIDVFRGDIDPYLMMDSPYAGHGLPDYRVDAFLVRTGSKAFAEALARLVESENINGYLKFMDFYWDKRRLYFYRRTDEVVHLVWVYSVRNGTVYPVVELSEEEDWDSEKLKDLEKIGWKTSTKPVVAGIGGAPQ
ncbi:MAG: hypothetical protein KAW39_00925 [Thermoplasmata archaeon]|nr:hypothetical protein [Thermoplasmata archaeon]